jgi:hypothetical protein
MGSGRGLWNGPVKARNGRDALPSRVLPRQWCLAMFGSV